MNLKEKVYLKSLSSILPFAVLFATLPFHQISAATNTGSVVGVVFAEEFSTPVEGVVVKIYDTKKEKFYSNQLTDKYEPYAINNVPVGDYNVVVSTKEGDFITDMMVNVRADLPTSLSLSLKPDKIAPKEPEKKKKWYKKS